MVEFNEQNKTGLLLNDKDIKLHRRYFVEMCKLIGQQVIYRAPQPGKSWTNYAEIDSRFQTPELVGCIFDEYPNQWTMKKLGWVSELDEGASIIHVPYDLHDIQVGALFIIPSGIDNSQGRLFRVAKMRVAMIYPASVTCELVPEFLDTYSNDLNEHSTDDFSLLDEEVDCNQP